ncbi:MAG: LysE family transporter [Alphaproteobacteria bacterium]|nr:LysE family transporter [Alphaproteobacteria bacterium]
MDFFLLWLIFASVQLAATMSPGPAFIVATRNAMMYGRRAGVYTALGLGLGVGAHVVFVLCGLAVVLSQSVLLFNIIKYAGAAYLIFIGAKALLHGGKAAEIQTMQVGGQKSLSVFKAVKHGFLTNLLNPKAVIFFGAIFTQFLQPGMSSGVLVLYGTTSVMVEILWFSGLSIVLTHAKVRARFTAISGWFDRVCGGLLMALGVRLALSKLH